MLLKEKNLVFKQDILMPEDTLVSQRSCQSKTSKEKLQDLSENNLPNVKLLIFNTHGESIGRGGHPVSLLDRLSYVNCPFTRKKLREWNINLVQEISFQGEMVINIL